jgi:hypothetical protein
VLQLLSDEVRSSSRGSAPLRIELEEAEEHTSGYGGYADSGYAEAAYDSPPAAAQILGSPIGYSSSVSPKNPVSVKFLGSLFFSVVCRSSLCWLHCGLFRAPPHSPQCLFCFLQYMSELELQVLEKKSRQEREKREQDELEARKAREAAEYDYFSRRGGGGGAPMRDADGNVRKLVLCACVCFVMSCMCRTRSLLAGRRLLARRRGQPRTPPVLILVLKCRHTPLASPPLLLPPYHLVLNPNIYGNVGCCFGIFLAPDTALVCTSQCPRRTDRREERSQGMRACAVISMNGLVLFLNVYAGARASRC